VARIEVFEFIKGFYSSASQHPSVYVVEERDFADRDAIPWGILRFGGRVL
jgi:hypothetical protein